MRSKSLNRKLTRRQFGTVLLEDSLKAPQLHWQLLDKKGVMHMSTTASDEKVAWLKLTDGRCENESVLKRAGFTLKGLPPGKMPSWELFLRRKH